MAARKRIVGKSGVGADEDVVFERDALPQLHAAFQRDAMAHHRAAFNKRVIAEIAIGADARAREHMREGPDPRAGADVGALDAAVRMLEMQRRWRVPAQGRRGRRGPRLCRSEAVRGS